MSLPRLQIAQLESRLGDFVLGPISFDLPPRAWLVLLGPSGSGKTTLLRYLAGVWPCRPDAIRVDGRPIGHLPPEQRRLAYVAQANDLFPHLTVAENIAFGLRFMRLSRAERNDRIRRFLDRFRLAHRANHRASVLSGGEGRRLALARALVIEPRLLLLDEPLGMLDPNSRRELHECLGMIHDELGTTAIHVTHDREEAWTLDSLCGILINGRLLQMGPAQTVFRRPISRAVAQFLGLDNVVPAPEVGGPSGRWALLRPEHLRLLPPDSTAGVPATVQTCRDRGAFWEIVLSPTPGRRWIAHVGGPLSPSVSPGHTARVHWRPEDLWLLNDEDTQ